ncbi:hypothetical protein MKW98_014710 [Papaver atlanticum]|uniref:Secreted protein n=1 Tax=Papaver atlanticum TaxID=357466 RepID=A0AAD4SF58_9MAGN|nr:hypothetical protein MKW98_014710 [Papaver atlanticum]
MRSRDRESSPCSTGTGSLLFFFLSLIPFLPSNSVSSARPISDFLSLKVSLPISKRNPSLYLIFSKGLYRCTSWGNWTARCTWLLSYSSRSF